MEITSTINERYTFFIISCFIGSLILILSFNHAHYIKILFLVQKVEISTPNSQISHPLNCTENEMCNIFDGKWVYNSKANPMYNGAQCPFLTKQVTCQRNGRPDSDYERWNWEAKSCEIPRFNGTDMLERLRGKRLIIVGDSLNRNQWESLVCLLYSSISPSRAHVDTRNGAYKVFRAKDYKCLVEFYWSPFLVQLEVNKSNGTRVLNLDEVSGSSQKWQGADVMVFNTGHWWGHRNAWDMFNYKGKSTENMSIESAYKMALQTWSCWIDHHVDQTKTKVFFRSISPEHKGKQSCTNALQPIMDESYVATYPKTMIDIVERTIDAMRIPVRYLNITRLSQHRRDAHPAVYGKHGKGNSRQPETHADCSHWCLPGLPDTWNRLLYVSIVFDTSRNGSLTNTRDALD